MNQRFTYAGRAERFFAYLIDTLILILPGLILTFLLQHEGLATLATFIASLGYYTYFIGGHQQASPGQRMLGMYVTHADGSPLSQRDAFERFLAFVLPSLPLYTSILSTEIAASLVFWLNILWFSPILVTPERMGLHDRLCRTRVVVGKVGT